MAFTAANGASEYLAGSKQRIPIKKTAARTSVALIPFSVFDLAGNPGAGTLAGANAANGVVPTTATNGTPNINPFGSGNTGYLTKVEYANSVISNLYIYDLLWKGGTYAYNSGTTNLSSQPAISSRCPDYPGSGTSFGNGVEIWVEVSTAFLTGNNWRIQVTYTNQAGTGSRTSIISAAQAAAALTLGKWFQLALQAGDSGVQKIDQIVATNGTTAMTAGAVNVLLVRKLWSNRVFTANGGGIDDIFKTGANIVYADSALIMVVQADGTSTGLPNIDVEITNA